jgi:hypothetical protein
MMNNKTALSPKKKGTPLITVERCMRSRSEGGGGSAPGAGAELKNCRVTSRSRNDWIKDPYIASGRCKARRIAPPITRFSPSLKTSLMAAETIGASQLNTVILPNNSILFVAANRISAWTPCAEGKRRFTSRSMSLAMLSACPFSVSTASSSADFGGGSVPGIGRGRGGVSVSSLPVNSTVSIWKSSGFSPSLSTSRHDTLDVNNVPTRLAL